MSEQTDTRTSVGRFLNEAPINPANLMFDDAEAPEGNELIDAGADYRNEYYQEDLFLNSDIGTPTGPDGEEPANAGILTGTVLGDGFETYHLFKSGEQLEAIVKGISIAATAMDLGKAIGSGNYLDPFGWLGGQIMSWMLEHVEPMRKTLDALAGNPDMVGAYTNSWKEIATRLTEVAAGWAQSVESGTKEWVGDAADAYRAKAAEQVDRIGGWSANATVLSLLNEQLGKLVDTVRGLISGILSALAEVLVEVTIILLASAGTGAVAATARAMFGISSASLKISTVLADLAKAVFDLKELGTAAAQAIATIAKIEQIA